MTILGIAALLVPIVAGSPADTIHLPELYRAVVAEDARARQRTLTEDVYELKLENLRAERLPSFRFQAEGTYQSDATGLPAGLPGTDLPEPPRLRLQTAVSADQILYDGGLLQAREAVESARRAEQDAELETKLYPLRMQVDEAFFTALILQESAAEIRVLMGDLEARLREVRSQFSAGAALAGDTAALKAERLRAEQSLEEVEAGRRVALRVLGQLSGTAITPDEVLALPELASDVERARAAGAVRARPEFKRLALQRQRLEREVEVLARRSAPNVRAFGQAGVGRPGPFQLFEDTVNEFWLAGIRLQWQPWSWGSNERDGEMLRLQQAIAATEEAALLDQLQRQTEPELEAMARLERARRTDAQIISLREQVELQALRQFEEGVLTASQYVAARSDVTEARLEWQKHRIELERARARYLTALGVVPQSRRGSR